MSFRLLSIGLVAAVMVMGLMGCAEVRSISDSAAGKAAQTTIADARADTKAIGEGLAKSAKTITGEAQGVRTDAQGAPSDIKQAIDKRADALVKEAATIEAQAAAVDPGITRRMDQLSSQVATVTEERDMAVTRAAKAEKDLEAAISFVRWVPLLFLVMLASSGAFALKFHPAFQFLPAEPFLIVAVECGLAIAWIFLTVSLPTWTAIITGIVVLLAALVPLAGLASTIWRLNAFQARVKA